jgi:hypothetical protein
VFDIDEFKKYVYRKFDPKCLAWNLGAVSEREDVAYCKRKPEQYTS